MKKGLQIQPTEIHWLLECIQTERELVSLMLLLADLGSLGKAAVEVRDRSLAVPQCRTEQQHRLRGALTFQSRRLTPKQEASN